MRAVDTNVVVRCLVNDDPVQGERARTVLSRETVWIPTTVILETNWVLKKTYGYRPEAIATALRQFIGLATIELENPDVVIQALDWFTNGMDFDDAMHLAASKTCEAMISFDLAFAKAARRIGAPLVEAP